MLAERVIEWTEEWKRQGLEQGRQEGLRQGWHEGQQKGRQEGEAAMLLRLLERRFGFLDEMSRCRIQTANAETLLDWGDRLLTARSLADVFGDDPAAPG